MMKGNGRMTAHLKIKIYHLPGRFQEALHITGQQRDQTTYMLNAIRDSQCISNDNGSIRNKGITVSYITLGVRKRYGTGTGG
jgi:hypothetical protein